MRVSVRVGVADCCRQTAGKSDKMRISHVIKTDQWRSALLRILSCSTFYYQHFLRRLKTHYDYDFMYCIIILCFSYLATWLPFFNKPID